MHSSAAFVAACVLFRQQEIKLVVESVALHVRTTLSIMGTTRRYLTCIFTGYLILRDDFDSLRTQVNALRPLEHLWNRPLRHRLIRLHGVNTCDVYGQHDNGRVRHRESEQAFSSKHEKR